MHDTYECVGQATRLCLQWTSPCLTACVRTWATICIHAGQLPCGPGRARYGLSEGTLPVSSPFHAGPDDTWRLLASVVDRDKQEIRRCLAGRIKSINNLLWWDDSEWDTSWLFGKLYEIIQVFVWLTKWNGTRWCN
jgi:hypothetical protein